MKCPKGHTRTARFCSKCGTNMGHPWLIFSGVIVTLATVASYFNIWSNVFFYFPVIWIVAVLLMWITVR